MLYVYEGQAHIEGQVAESGHLVLFDSGSEAVLTTGHSKGMRALLLSGHPFGAPIARYGPFVMNTHTELAKAFSDYQAGRMGTLNSKDA